MSIWNTTGNTYSHHGNVQDMISKVLVNGQFSRLFYITKGVLQGDTLAPFRFIIVFDSVLKVTELENFGIQTHPDKLRCIGGGSNPSGGFLLPWIHDILPSGGPKTPVRHGMGCFLETGSSLALTIPQCGNKT